MDDRISVLIVDDHPLFCDGLKLLLTTMKEFGQVTACHSGALALELVAQSPPDLVLLDWHLGGGLSGGELIEALKPHLKQGRIVVLSAEVNAKIIFEAVEHGALGFVPKTSSSDELLHAIRITAAGRVFLPRIVPELHHPQVLPPTGHDTVHDGEPPTVQTAFPFMTKRQVDVFLLMLRGVSNKAICQQLFISEGTVKNYLSKIYRDLNVNNRTEVVYLCAKLGIKAF